MANAANWRAGRTDIDSYNLGTGEPFATVYAGGQGRDAVVIARVFGEWPEACHGRARLMAAAPEMLAALYRIAGMVRAPNSSADADAIRAEVEAAIAEAEGK